MLVQKCFAWIHELSRVHIPQDSARASQPNVCGISNCCRFVGQNLTCYAMLRENLIKVEMSMVQSLEGFDPQPIPLNKNLHLAARPFTSRTSQQWADESPGFSRGWWVLACHTFRQVSCIAHDASAHRSGKHEPELFVCARFHIELSMSAWGHKDGKM